jgi:hypothetical protein
VTCRDFAKATFFSFNKSRLASGNLDAKHVIMFGSTVRKIDFE